MLTYFFAVSNYIPFNVPIENAVLYFGLHGEIESVPEAGCCEVNLAGRRSSGGYDEIHGNH